jgi:C1A family cysteine protease
LADHLSVEYLAHHAVAATPNWEAGHGLGFPAVGVALAVPGQPLESTYPYQATQHDQPLKIPPSTVGALHTSVVKQTSMDSQTVITTLQTKKPVCLGLAITNEWFAVKDGVIQYSTSYTTDLHAVLGVGLGIDPATGEHYVFIRNSWGASWGSNGHAWLPGRYLKTHLVASFIY